MSEIPTREEFEALVGCVAEGGHADFDRAMAPYDAMTEHIKELEFEIEFLQMSPEEQQTWTREEQNRVLSRGAAQIRWADGLTAKARSMEDMSKQHKFVNAKELEARCEARRLSSLPDPSLPWKTPRCTLVKGHTGPHLGTDDSIWEDT